MKANRRLLISLAALLAIALCLCLVAYAINYTVIDLKDNSFQTGTIDIDFNDEQALIASDEFIFEPGMTVDKPFYIQNNGSWAVYYKVFLKDITGDLGDVIIVTILDESNEVLWSDKLSRLTQENALVFNDELAIGEKRDMIMRFHYPEYEGNRTQESSVSFILSAIAVQAKNNPEREFE